MEPDEKIKKHLPRKAKFAIIIIVSVIAILGAAAAVYFFLIPKPEPAPEVVITDAMFLAETASWERLDAPQVIWSFNEDGTGQLTTNKANYYTINWSLEEGETNQLKIVTNWLYELDDSFEFELNREEPSFKVKNLSDETESVFVPLGTAERRAHEQKEETTELEKTEE